MASVTLGYSEFRTSEYLDTETLAMRFLAVSDLLGWEQGNTVFPAQGESKINLDSIRQRMDWQVNEVDCWDDVNSLGRVHLQVTLQEFNKSDDIYSRFSKYPGLIHMMTTTLEGSVMGSLEEVCFSADLRYDSMHYAGGLEIFEGSNKSEAWRGVLEIFLPQGYESLRSTVQQCVTEGLGTLDEKNENFVLGGQEKPKIPEYYPDFWVGVHSSRLHLSNSTPEYLGVVASQMLARLQELLFLQDSEYGCQLSDNEEPLPVVVRLSSSS